MIQTQTTAEQFKAAARPVFGTVSGDPARGGYRIAVRNKTHGKQLAALAEQYRGTVEIPEGRFPALTRITFPQPAEEISAAEEIAR